MHPDIILAGALDQVHHRYSIEIANEQGYFQEEGLVNIETILAPSEDDLATIMMDGKLHFILDVRPQSVFRWIAKKGFRVYIVGGYRNRMGGQMFAAKDIKSIAELKRRMLGVVSAGPRISLDAQQARILLRRTGLDPSTDVVWVSGGMRFNADVGNPQDALRSGEVDCVFVSDTNAARLKDEGYNALLTSFAEIYPEGYPDRAIAASVDFTQRYPRAVTAFLKCIIRGYRFIRDMPANFDYIKNLDRRMRARDNNPVERLLDPQWTIDKLVSLPFPPDGRTPIKGLETILAQEKEVGNIPSALTLEEVTKFEFVEQANTELESRDDLQPQLQRVQQWVRKFGF